MNLKAKKLREEEDLPSISYTYFLEEVDYLDNAYSKYKMQRDSVFDDLFGTAPSQHMEDKEEEFFTGYDLLKYMEYLQDNGYIDIVDDREEWEK